MGRLAAILASVIMNALLLQAQEQPQQSAPKTKLEAFKDQKGVVVIRGFSKIGLMRGAYGGMVTVQSMEFTNAATGTKEYGIAVDVNEATHLEREDRSVRGDESDAGRCPPGDAYGIDVHSRSL